MTSITEQAAIDRERADARRRVEECNLAALESFYDENGRWPTEDEETAIWEDQIEGLNVGHLVV